jgi:hypothetical protein
MLRLVDGLFVLREDDFDHDCRARPAPQHASL